VLLCATAVQYRPVKLVLEQEPQQVQQWPEQEELLELLERQNQLWNL